MGSPRSKNAGFRIGKFPFASSSKGGCGATAASTDVCVRGCLSPLKRLPDNHKMAVIGTTFFNGIAAGFYAFPLLLIGDKMPFGVLNGEAKPQFLLVFLEQLNIKELRRHDKVFFAFPVKHIKRFKVAAIASPRLGYRGGGCGVGDKVIHFAAKVDAGFATGIEDEEVIRWRDLFVLKDVVAGGKLFCGHRMVGVCGTPYTYWVVPCGGSDTFTFFHHRDVRHIQHTGFAARHIFEGLPQAAIRLGVAVLVLPQLLCINGNNMLRASQLIKRFRGGSDANHHNGRVGRGFADGVAGNAGKVGLRTECGEDDDVVCLVADDDLKVCGKGRVVLHPHTELGVGGNNGFVGRELAPGDIAACRFRKEHIRHCEGFILCQTKVTVLGINQEQCFAGR